jgi:hypothetical protein
MLSEPYAVVLPYSTWPVAGELTVQTIVAVVWPRLVALTETMLAPDGVAVGATVDVGVGVGVAVDVGVGVGVAVGDGPTVGGGVAAPVDTFTTALASIDPAGAASRPLPYFDVAWALTSWVPPAAPDGIVSWALNELPESARTTVPVEVPSQRRSIHSRASKPKPVTVTPLPGTAVPETLSEAAKPDAPAVGAALRSSTHLIPSQNIDPIPFGDPADSESPVALRPRVASGLPFRGSPDARGRTPPSADRVACRHGPLYGGMVLGGPTRASLPPSWSHVRLVRPPIGGRPFGPFLWLARRVVPNQQRTTLRTSREPGCAMLNALLR